MTSAAPALASSPPTRVIALGQAAAGDDGVGYRVLARLRSEPLPRDVELLSVPDPSELVELLKYDGRVVLLDALVGAGPPGRVLVLSPEELESLALSSVSSHGVSAGQALALCQTLYADAAATDVHIVAVSIEPPRRYEVGLSSAVEAAVSTALETTLELL